MKIEVTGYRLLVTGRSKLSPVTCHLSPMTDGGNHGLI